MAIKAEYIWIDGTEPTAKLRSKTKILEKAPRSPRIWGFDGSSTNQAPGSASDCVLKPVLTVPDPIRGGDNILVLTEVLLTDMTPHPTNTRAATRRAGGEVRRAGADRSASSRSTPSSSAAAPRASRRTASRRPRARTTAASAPTRSTAGPWSRPTWSACLDAGLLLSGINAEVMPGQWEFQIGPASTLEVGDHLWTGPLAPLPHR